MNALPASDPSDFLWEPQPEAARFIAQQVSLAVEGSQWLSKFQRRLLQETGTRLIDWLDHLVLAEDTNPSAEGFALNEDGIAWEHPGGLFPRLLLSQTSSTPTLAIKVESIDNFLAAHQLGVAADVTGDAVSDLRMAEIELDERTWLRVVQRRGDAGFAPAQKSPSAEEINRVLTSFRRRNRGYDNALDGVADAMDRFCRAEKQVGPGRACHHFFQAEREYWQGRNRAAQVQHARQEQLGLGWANHDHHTYRCSREYFAPLISFLERLGFFCRERFYAGSDAGWGAQVLEHPVCGIVIFADVDMSEGELTGDFAHAGLAERDELGTVGLWCKLHGDSFLEAGMHHLECQFDFDCARQQLSAEGIETMAPFTDFPFLRQAFTQGERWRVPRQRLDMLVARRAITVADAESFESLGALGSHLEILERNDGYKGFNQTGVSKIIKATDPRRAR